MKKIMTMTEVLAKLNVSKKRMQSTTFEMARPSGASIFVTAKKTNRSTTVSGTNISDAEKGIQSNFDMTMDNFSNAWKLLMVKEAVNSMIRITIPNPDFRKGGTITATITEVLSLCGDGSISKKYYNQLLSKMQAEYNNVTSLIKKNEETVLSQERITDYVIQRLNALKENTSKDAVEKVYDEYAKEYIAANTLEIVDPIDIMDKINKLDQWITDFYTTVNFRLSEVNSKTKVWIDFDLDNDFWGLVNEDEIDNLSSVEE